ncbi:MAG TPA: GspH/FimT family pseudopilin [Steroidobacteraceae bacterium]|jgi:type IV fimbrial biogenesis protein FimT|nr:GspH/FimT family pseudopilin [Steroidobacteraceae bacterium]
MLMQRPRHASGFTMIEAMVTLAIFAILVAIGTPTMSTWIRNNKVRSVTDALQTGLRLAQTESLRRSRQVVFALTNSTTPTTIPLPAVANGTSWAIWTVPSMTDGSETPVFVQSGILSNASTGVQVNSNGTAVVCFNSVGRLTNNASANITLIAGGGNSCTQPTAGLLPGTPPVQIFNISIPGGDRPLQVTLGLGGQVHMCDPNVPISDSHPEGCQ